MKNTNLWTETPTVCHVDVDNVIWDITAPAGVHLSSFMSALLPAYNAFFGVHATLENITWDDEDE